jgi:AbrB family looped-hinge helix DNA binding protein
MSASQTSVTLTSKRQITVPARVARALKLSTGDQLDYTLKDGALTLTPRPSLHQQVAALHALTAGASKGAATNASINRTLADYHRTQTKRP